MNRLLVVLIVALLALAPGFAAAQDVLIRNATLHTMTEDGVLEDTDVLITGGEILRIGRDLAVAQDDFPVIDAGGKPVTPGLFAGVTALGLVEVGAVDATVDGSYKGLGELGLGTIRPEFDVTPAYNPNSSLVAVTRIEGFTFSVLGARRDASIIGGQGRAVWLDGGYRSFAGDPVLFIDVGGDAAGVAGGSRAAQWMLLNQAMNEAADPPDPNEEALLTRAGREALDDFTRGGRVLFNVDRASDILATLRFAQVHGLQAIIGGGVEAWVVADELAAADVPVLLDPLVNLPGDFDRIGARLDNAALLHAAGVRIAFARPASLESHNARKMRQLAGNAVAHGLPHEAALRALTVEAAAIFGLDDVTGSIERGKRGDLTIWSGDPLEVTEYAERVVIGGRPMPMTSRQTELRDRYLAPAGDLPRAYEKP